MKRHPALWSPCLLLSLLLAPCFAQPASPERNVTYYVKSAEEAVALAQQLQSGSSADPLAGVERILSYDIDVQVNADNTLDVEEHIRVHAAGSQIRRGIYRDFPTRYKDRHDNNVVVGFEVKDVLRNGKPEPWFTEAMSNGVRVNTGNDDFLQAPADYTYTLRYRTNRQVGFFKDHDELYWNAIGTGWVFPIETGSVRVRLPQPVPVADLRAEGYTGAQGSHGQGYTAILPAPGEARWQLDGPLPPFQGLTIVLSFPKGIVTQPSLPQRLRWFLKDNRGVLVALGTLLLMLGYLYLRWWQVGRDPEPGLIIVRYNPPQGYSPAALRFIRERNTDDRCFTADLLALAVKGLVRIRSENRPLGADKWTLERTSASAGGDLPDSQRALLDGLFKDGNVLKVAPDNRPKFMATRLAQFRALEAAYAGRMFKRNAGYAGKAMLMGIVGMAVAFFLADGAGTPLLATIGATMFITLIASVLLLAAPTPEGRKLLDEVEGLKRYLTVAERDELASLQGPDAPPVLDAERYQFLLPYAIALDVEEAWTKTFTAAVGEAAAQRAASSMDWYHGSSVASLTQLSSSLGSSLNSQIASASTPPGSSSGGGGGGSSGGGGGGGGGGGR